MTHSTKELFRTIQRLCAADPRYASEAYLFTLAALHFTIAVLPAPRHITGQELLTGVRQYALDQFGPLARAVLEHWGVRATEDFGRLVFALVEAKVLSKTEDDTLDDFRGVYDFEEAFGPSAVTYTLADDLPDLPAAKN